MLLAMTRAQYFVDRMHAGSHGVILVALGAPNAVGDGNHTASGSRSDSKDRAAGHCEAQLWRVPRQPGEHWPEEALLVTPDDAKLLLSAGAADQRSM